MYFSSMGVFVSKLYLAFLSESTKCVTNLRLDFEGKGKECCTISDEKQTVTTHGLDELEEVIVDNGNIQLTMGAKNIS